MEADRMDENRPNMTNTPNEIVLTADLGRLIRSVRGQRVILDVDLARIYDVETRALNQAVKRNQARFPEDFVFDLTREEIQGMSQTVISLRGAIACPDK